MSNFGTALQVLAGAFGHGASSLGASRIAADRYDREEGLRKRELNHTIMSDNRDFKYGIARDQAEDELQRERIRQAIKLGNIQAATERYRADATRGGLTGTQQRTIQEWADNLGISFDEAYAMYFSRNIPRRRLTGGTGTSPKPSVVPPVAAPPRTGAPGRTGGVDRNNPPIP